jgi:putative ABC transport system permease protein
MTSEFGHSLRRLWRSPGFSCVVVVTLALGIGVNIALLTVLLALLGTGGVALPADLVAVTRIEPARGDDWNSVRKPELDAIASGTRAMFSQVIVHDWVTATLRSPTVSLSARGQLVSGNYFQTFGVVPTIGRLLHVADDLPFSHSTPLVVSEHFWRRHLQADPQVVGRQLTVNRHPVVVVGVAPNSFRGTWMPSILRTDFWMPVAASEAIMPREARHPSHRVLAVLRKGVSLTEADASVAAIGAGLVPWEGPALRLSVVPARAGIIPPQFDRLVHTVGATAIALGAIVLVIACANVSGLVAARTARRDSEVAIRTALGAGRSHLRRILAGEVAILGTVACLVAILLAHAVAVATVDRISGIASIVAFEPELALTGPVALLTLVVAVLACVVAGAPAVRRSLAIAPWACLGQGDGATSTVPAARRFVCLQVGITTVLLVPAGLLWGNARDALTRDPGFDLLHGATALVGPINEGMSAGQPFDVVGAILDDVRRIPDVVSVAATSSLPAISPPPLSLVSSVPHREAASDVRARVFVVTEGFFDALGIQLAARKTGCGRQRRGVPCPVACRRRARSGGVRRGRRPATDGSWRRCRYGPHCRGEDT